MYEAGTVDCRAAQAFLPLNSSGRRQFYDPDIFSSVIARHIAIGGGSISGYNASAIGRSVGGTEFLQVGAAQCSLPQYISALVHLQHPEIAGAVVAGYVSVCRE